MKKAIPPADADAYVASLAGWQRERVEMLRVAVRASPGLAEGIKWGHLVYQAQGPVCLIRAEEHRVLFGFWRGRRLRDVEPRLKPGGKYEMATLELGADSDLSAATARRLVRQAIQLNEIFGNPTDAAPVRKAAAKGRTTSPKVRRTT